MDDTTSTKPQTTKSYKVVAMTNTDGGLFMTDYASSSVYTKKGTQIAPRNTTRIFSVNSANANKWKGSDGSRSGNTDKSGKKKDEFKAPKFTTLREAVNALQTRECTLQNVCGSSVGYGYDADQKRAILILRTRDNIIKTTEFERACNGLVLDTENWNIISYPPNFASKTTSLKHIKKNFEDYQITRLEDGSCVTLYWYNDEWCMSSGKCIDIRNHQLVFPCSFMRGFLHAAKSIGAPDILNRLDTATCYTFVFRSEQIHPLTRCPGECVEGIWLVRAVCLFDTPIENVNHHTGTGQYCPVGDNDGVVNPDHNPDTLDDEDGVDEFDFGFDHTRIPKNMENFIELDINLVSADIKIPVQETIDVQSLITGGVRSCIEAVNTECNNALKVYMDIRLNGLKFPDSERSPISSALTSRENSNRSTPITSDGEGGELSDSEEGEDDVNSVGSSMLPIVSTQKMLNPLLYKPVYGYMFTYKGADPHPEKFISIKLQSQLMRQIENTLYRVDVPLNVFGSVKDVGDYVLLRAFLSDAWLLIKLVNNTTSAKTKLIGDAVAELKLAIITMLMRPNAEKQEYMASLSHTSAAIVMSICSHVKSQLESGIEKLPFDGNNVKIVTDLVVTILNQETMIVQIIPWIRDYSERQTEKAHDLDI